MTLALLFPGQGSQSVGMGSGLADAFASAREVYAEIDDALGQKLSVLMREGPEDQLTLTENGSEVATVRAKAVVPSGKRVPGLWKGMATIVSDDDEHLSAFAEYMPCVAMPA